ncbi:pentatricopeptide repeat protein [Aspergillus sclerotialis]|uniref:Pentatricopeptide repeat protein n=1 Tax=Aspergillus sclerotialis TaxID=2070753 RepID=A0A3A2ZWN1_9EURO|nr:pentatricopeptide repeat protein [Aspergillus sclerotialis]
MAMRHAWVRTLRVTSRRGAISPLHPCPGRIAPSRVGRWSISIPTKIPTTRYSSTSEKKAEASTAENTPDIIEDPASSLEHASARSDEVETPEHGIKRKHKVYANPLLMIAMAGSSKRAREEVPELVRPSLSEKMILKELDWLKDPKDLANRVARLLKGDVGDVASAAELVRRAQKSGFHCIVSWNHILHHMMEKKQPLAAFKLYNDMKKRGRKPNAATYTIMLKGLANAPPHSGLNPVKTALSIYYSISGRNDKVFNIYHTNAMLHVCSVHGDMQAMWKVAGDMPEEGENSPHATAYTVILNSIRRNCARDVAEMAADDAQRISERRYKALIEGKRVWADIVYRWKRGQLEFDGGLVDAMAYLLLEGATDMDCYDVLALISQTTGVPIFAQKPSVRKRAKPIPAEKERNNTQAREDVDDVPFVDGNGKILDDPDGESEQPQETEEVEEEEEEENFDDIFDPVSTTEGGKRKGPPLVKFGNKELSTVMEACMTMEQGVRPAKMYWHFLTQEDSGYKFELDDAACHQYLRVLRIGRSSRSALELVRDQMIPKSLARKKTFHIAISCARRDRKNINVFMIANELLDLMNDYLLLPNLSALEGYLLLIQGLAANPQFLISLNGLNLAKNEQSKNLSVVGQKLQLKLKKEAVRKLRPHVAKLNEAMENGLVSTPQPKGRLALLFRDHGMIGGPVMQVFGRTRLMVDQILNAESLPLSKAERAEFQKDSDALKKYSDANVFQKYHSAKIVPTDDQILEFRNRKGSLGG